MSTTPLAQRRERRFSTAKILGEAPEDGKRLHLMHGGRLNVLRGFYQPQHKRAPQPMPERSAAA